MMQSPHPPPVVMGVPPVAHPLGVMGVAAAPVAQPPTPPGGDGCTGGRRAVAGALSEARRSLWSAHKRLLASCLRCRKQIAVVERSKAHCKALWLGSQYAALPSGFVVASGRRALAGNAMTTPPPCALVRRRVLRLRLPVLAARLPANALALPGSCSQEPGGSVCAR